MSLPERCPNCLAPHAIRRSVENYGTPDEWSFLYCTKCPYNVEEP